MPERLKAVGNFPNSRGGFRIGFDLLRHLFVGMRNCRMRDIAEKPGEVVYRKVGLFSSHIDGDLASPSDFARA